MVLQHRTNRQQRKSNRLGSLCCFAAPVASIRAALAPMLSTIAGDRLPSNLFGYSWEIDSRQSGGMSM
jgi:hypothetical protein